jgi:hypothetical protein
MSQRNSGYQRQPDDVYETPPWVTQIVAEYLRLHCLNIWDPANGPGSKIAQVLRKNGFRVVATNNDFLSEIAPSYDRIDAIVTSPPYGNRGRLACQFIAHALELAPIVAMLLRVDFDSAKTRVKLFRDCRTFVHKIVLLDRIVWFEREDASDNPSDTHAWYIWNRRHQGLPTIIYAGKNSGDARIKQGTRHAA